jgi:hypothetical protein
MFLRVALGNAERLHFIPTQLTLTRSTYCTERTLDLDRRILTKIQKANTRRNDYICSWGRWSREKRRVPINNIHTRNNTTKKMTMRHQPFCLAALAALAAGAYAEIINLPTYKPSFGSTSSTYYPTYSPTTTHRPSTSSSPSLKPSVSSEPSISSSPSYEPSLSLKPSVYNCDPPDACSDTGGEIGRGSCKGKNACNSSSREYCLISTSICWFFEDL